MTKRNKNKLKQRKKKQLKRQLKRVSKPVKEPVITNNEEQKKLYQSKLDKIYGAGAIVPLNDYVNDMAVIVHKCNECGLRFFARPSHMLGLEHQRHQCNMALGDQYGNRFAVASGKSRSNKGKTNNKETLKIINEMIWEDYSYREIAEKLKVNPNIIKDYFKAEGLI